MNRALRFRLTLGVLLLPWTQVHAQQGVQWAAGTFPVSGSSLPVDEGRLVVPANRSGTSSATLTLRFVRFRSTAATPGAPIVFLAGGPGDAGTRALRGMPIAILDALRAIADVIAFDQRGTGLSEPLNARCYSMVEVPRDRAADPGTMLMARQQQVAGCLLEAPRRGVDVLGLTTVESAHDLEALRLALGARKLSLLAGSYGTHLALATARLHPDAIDRMALAGVEGPDDTFKRPALVEEVVRRIGLARRPTLLDDLRLLKSRLAADAGRLTLPGGAVVVVGAWDLQRWLAESLDNVREIDAMLAAIPAMLQGDYTVLGRWAFGDRLTKPTNLMNLAMDCASYASTQRLAMIRREADSTVVGDAINFPMPGLCEVPGLPRLPEAYRAPLRSKVPALLVSGTFDGRTPVQNAVEVARGMPNARSLVIEGASHGLFQEERAMQAILAFLAERRE